VRESNRGDRHPTAAHDGEIRQCSDGVRVAQRTVEVVDVKTVVLASEQPVVADGRELAHDARRLDVGLDRVVHREQVDARGIPARARSTTSAPTLAARAATG
jgi:hypothetical protein